MIARHLLLSCSIVSASLFKESGEESSCLEPFSSTSFVNVFYLVVVSVRLLLSSLRSTMVTTQPPEVLEPKRVESGTMVRLQHSCAITS
jgi:hypothetical protein